MRSAAIVVAVALTACSTTSPETRSREQASLAPEQVRLVQRALTRQGFPVPLSGNMDGETHAAIAEFQRAAKLPDTGDLDATTQYKLGVNPNDVAPVRGEDSPNPQSFPVWEGGGM